MDALDTASRQTQLEAALLELVRARASQINGCVYCVNLHSRDARKAGVSERRYALPAWRETPMFTAREKAALELTEAVTRLADNPVTDVSSTPVRIPQLATDARDGGHGGRWCGRIP